MIIYDSSVSGFGSAIEGAVESPILYDKTGYKYISTLINMPCGTPTLIQKHIDMGARCVDENHWIYPLSHIPYMDLLTALRFFQLMHEHGADDTFITALVWLTDNNPHIARWMGIEDGFKLCLTFDNKETND